ncbi:hypothetical protein WJX73_000583 [Symbiochloris irregularis]|uniref:Polynucleotide adenylyltransferase n=1 Tax=Symbiochloris irregularis TaxID=706552 RepID=A0AAW1PIP7_9CHLO
MQHIGCPGLRQLCRGSCPQAPHACSPVFFSTRALLPNLPHRRAAARLRAKAQTDERSTTDKDDVDQTTLKWGLEAGLWKALTSKNEKGLSKGDQAKDLLKRYGGAYLLTSISFAAVSFAACYALVSAGVDVRGLLTKIGLQVGDSGERLGTFAIAYAAHKALSPVRFPPTVALTPVVARWIGKTSLSRASSHLYPDPGASTAFSCHTDSSSEAPTQSDKPETWQHPEILLQSRIGCPTPHPKQSGWVDSDTRPAPASNRFVASSAASHPGIAGNSQQVFPPHARPAGEPHQWSDYSLWSSAVGGQGNTFSSNSLALRQPAHSSVQTTYGLPMMQPTAAHLAGLSADDALLQLRHQRQYSRLESAIVSSGRDSHLMGLSQGQLSLPRNDWLRGPTANGPVRPGKSSKATAPMHRKPYSPIGGAILAAGPAADAATLNTALHQLVDELKPMPAEVEGRTQAFELVQAVLLARWPEAKVHVFGSSANNLSICNNNDVDMTLELQHLPDAPGAKAAVVEEMGRLFMQAGVKDVLLLPKARVPVVKLVAPTTNTRIDLTVNNLLAIVNTKLLRDYSVIDPRLAQLVFVVKHWAKRRQVNDAYRGTLSSYCYVLMCIAHLQHRSPPILPCLQALPPTHIRTIGRWNCDYHDQVEGLRGYGAGNTETLGDLVWSFFEFWAWRHDFNNSVVTIRTTTPVSKAEKEWTKRVGNERHLVSIEDPFELSHDLGRTMDRQTTSVLHKEFERAAGLLRDDPEPLPKLLEPYRAAKYDA